MKKKAGLIVIVAVMIAILVIPVPTGVYKDGGTREYTALTYKIVDWNRMTGVSIYDETRVYFFPHNFKSIDALWYYEEDKVAYTLTAEVLEISGKTVVAQLISGDTADKICFSTEGLEELDVASGTVVKVTYKGGVMETYPAQINAIKWEISKDLRHKEYPEQWLDKETAEKYDDDIVGDIVITEIYANCFFATRVIPSPITIKINGALSEQWCVGDQVICTCENTYYDSENHKIEADMLTVEASDWQPEPGMAYKPVIYLYPEEETKVSVELLLDGKLTCTYPACESGWQVTAQPDGTLTDTRGQTYNYLYWEGQLGARWDMTKGFCVKGEDTAQFLEDALEKLGLNRREANEFIVYWLPLMEQNPYNVISFQEDVYTDAARLKVNPAPDTVIRVFMAWQKADAFVQLPEQELTAPERTGFTVVEWGGTEVN